MTSVERKGPTTVLRFENSVNIIGYANPASFKQISSPSWTACIRFRPKILRHGSTILEIPQEPGVTEDAKQLLKIKITHPDYTFIKIQRASVLIETRFKQNMWNNVCGYFNADTQKSTFFNNSEQFEIPVVIPVEDQVSLDAARLENTLIGTHVYKKAPYFGDIADLNIWGNQLTFEEMTDWMNCKSSMKGDIFNDEEHTYKVVNVNAFYEQDACKISKPGLFQIPQPMSFLEAQNYCIEIGGTLLKVNQENSQDVVKELQSNNFSNTIWSGYTKDDINNGLAAKLYTNQSFWEENEPNGFEFENCIAILPSSMKLWDYLCGGEKIGLCWLEEYKSFKIRNLNRVDIDDTFFFNKKLVNDQINFYGSTQDIIKYSGSGKWLITQMTPGGRKDLILYDTGLLFGIKAWTDTFTNSTQLLSFDHCSDDEFNCANGDCIQMQLKCNGWVDCIDNTDELECSHVDVPGTYDITSPPNENDTSSGLGLTIEFFKMLINSISDTKMKIQFGIWIKWRDSRLTFLDLLDRNYTTLSKLENEKIWYPSLGITLAEEALKESTEFRVLDVYTEAVGVSSASQRLSKAMLFDGKDVDIILRQWYEEITVICLFENLWKYPFDIQNCTITIHPTSTTIWTTLFNGIIRFSILPNTPQFPHLDLETVRIKNSNLIIDGNGSLQVIFTMDRGFLAIILQYFLPYLILSFVIYSSNTYYEKDLGWALTVNTTCLLAMTAFFSSIIQQVPKSSSVKIIDLMQIKHIFCGSWIMFLQTVHYMKKFNIVDSTKQVAWAETKREAKKLKCKIDPLKWSVKIGLPGLGVFLDGLFVVIGVLHNLEIYHI